jgi:hypothetical protein
LLPRDCQLVLNLELNVLGDTVTPELDSVDSGRLAFQDLHVVAAHDFPIDIGECDHPIRWAGDHV